MNTKDFVKEEFPANKNNSTDKKERTHSRRKALKKIALGGTIAVGASTLPPQWTKPIVDKVIVPAHAGTNHNLGTDHHHNYGRTHNDHRVSGFNGDPRIYDRLQ